MNKRLVLSLAAVALIAGIGVTFAERIGILAAYALQKVQGTSSVRVGNATLILPKDAFVISSDDRGAVVGFLHGFGKAHHVFVLKRPKADPVDMLKRRPDDGATISSIRPSSGDARDCFEAEYLRGSEIEERAMYCPEKELLLVAGAGQAQIWPRVPELLGYSETK